jgi:hypothetical protein
MKLSVRPLTVVVFAAIICVPCSFAQTNLDRRTSIDVNAAAPKDVYGSLARSIGCELSIAPEILTPVTMHISNLSARTALNALSESIGCRWSIEGKTLRVELAGNRKSGSGGVIGGVPGGKSGGVVGGVPGGGVGNEEFKQRLDRKTPPNFHFENKPVSEIMNALGKIADLELRVEGPAAEERVALDLSNLSILAALRTVQQQHGLKQSVIVGASLPGEKNKFDFMIGPQNKSK